jgi:hypothetical protein
MTKIGLVSRAFVLWFAPASRSTIVMIAFLSFARRALCAASADSSGRLLTTSPYTRMKSPVSRLLLSRSRIASPMECDVDWMSSSRENGEDAAAHFDFVLYSSTCSLCAPQYTKMSSTPALARNSKVYSMSGVLARGSKHYEPFSTAADSSVRRTYPRPLECEGIEARLEGVGEYLQS